MVFEHKFIILKEEAGLRLDHYLSNKKELDISRSRIQKLIKDSLVLVNAKPAKASHRLVPDEVVEITVPGAKVIEIKAQNLPLDIIFEDKDIIVVNKAKGMVVHPAIGNWDGTLVNALMYHVKDFGGISGEVRPGIVHRLDKDTSGVMVVAKNEKALDYLQKQFKARGVKKVYLALVHGIVKEARGEIRTLFGRHPVARQKMSVLEEGAAGKTKREAVTKFKVLKLFDKYSLLEVKIETGRTHQIRVHLNHIGHPIVGEQLYGKRNNDLGVYSQMLHAQKLSFKHPQTKKVVKIEAPLPEEFMKLSNRQSRQK